jgi:MarR family 2-MHQ and catechol resistance regulon transcriptional repressor
MPENEATSDISLDEKVMIFIVMASETFKKKSSVIFKKYGLTFSQYSVLKYLVSRKDGRDTAGAVGKSMLVTGANVTGLAKRMEKAGLIERKNDAKDERLTILQITPKGQNVLDTIRDLQERHIREYLRKYSQVGKEEVLEVLKHIVRTGKQLSGDLSTSRGA